MRRKVAVYTKIYGQDIERYFPDAIKGLILKIKSIKGKRFYNFVTRIGLDGNDFIMNATTVLVEANWFKKPRFIK